MGEITTFITIEALACDSDGTQHLNMRVTSTMQTSASVSMLQDRPAEQSCTGLIKSS